MTECDVQNVETDLDVAVTVQSCIDDAEQINLTTLPLNGVLAVENNNSVTYIPNASFTGQDQFVFESCNAAGDCFVSQVVVQVVSTMTVTTSAPVPVPATSDPPTAAMPTTSDDLSTTATTTSSGQVAFPSNSLLLGTMKCLVLFVVQI